MINYNPEDHAQEKEQGRGKESKNSDQHAARLENIGRLESGMWNVESGLWDFGRGISLTESFCRIFWRHWGTGQAKAKLAIWRTGRLKSCKEFLSVSGSLDSICETVHILKLLRR